MVTPREARGRRWPRRVGGAADRGAGGRRGEGDGLGLSHTVIDCWTWRCGVVVGVAGLVEVDLQVPVAWKLTTPAMILQTEDDEASW